MRRRSLHSLLVVRTMLIANGALLAVFSGIYLVLGAKPGGWIVGGVLGAAAIGLWLAVPLTDPYRSDRHRATW
ncbi:MAG TPA: hypothetical protein VN180_03740 [Acidimicrobiia bacterium]|jgi:hypothetical protein|nr:hypothetical protein [Acidimicrobiia bacterium]